MPRLAPVTRTALPLMIMSVPPVLSVLAPPVWRPAHIDQATAGESPRSRVGPDAGSWALRYACEISARATENGRWEPPRQPAGRPILSEAEVLSSATGHCRRGGRLA